MKKFVFLLACLFGCLFVVFVCLLIYLFFCTAWLQNYNAGIKNKLEDSKGYSEDSEVKDIYKGN